MSINTKPLKINLFCALFTVLCMHSVHGQELVVKISGAKSAQGEIGCALFSNSTGFPTENPGLPTLWQKANPEGVICRFAGIKPGPHALAASHDLNGNRRTDTNLVGMPKEDWGVSNNVRPSLRAPTFEEARFEVAPTGVTTIEVKLGR